MPLPVGKQVSADGKTINDPGVSNLPRSLYFASGYMPKLSDLRDAMRNNQLFHSRYNPVLDLPETKKYYAAALKPIEGENPKEFNAELEN